MIRNVSFRNSVETQPPTLEELQEANGIRANRRQAGGPELHEHDQAGRCAYGCFKARHDVTFKTLHVNLDHVDDIDTLGLKVVIQAECFNFDAAISPLVLKQAMIPAVRRRGEQLRPAVFIRSCRLHKLHILKLVGLHRFLQVAEAFRFGFHCDNASRRAKGQASDRRVEANIGADVHHHLSGFA